MLPRKQVTNDIHKQTYRNCLLSHAPKESARQKSKAFIVILILNTLWGVCAMGTPQLVGNWTFNEGSGLITYDTSGSNYNGTIIRDGSSPSWGTGYLNFNGALYPTGRVEVAGMPSFSTYQVVDFLA
jgi:hypothetical protein